MNDNTNIVKIRIQHQNSLIEYEGEIHNLNPDFLTTLGELGDLLETTAPAPLPNTGNGFESSFQNSSLKMTTGTIAGRTSVKSGPDLIMAAAAKLSLVDGRETFKRSELLTEMKSAPSYFNQNYSKNLSASLLTLIKGDQLREVAEGTFAIEAKTRDILSNQLAG